MVYRTTALHRQVSTAVQELVSENSSCVAVRRVLFAFDTLKYKDGLARKMADVKSEISRIFYVKYLTFLTSKDEFSVVAKTGPKVIHLKKSPRGRKIEPQLALRAVFM